MRAAFAIAIKDIRLLLRDPMAIFWTLCFPLIYAFFFGIISSGGSGARGAISLAVIDRDDTPTSRKFVERLAASEGLKLNKDFAKDEAAEQVRKGKLVAYVVVPKGFGNTDSMFGGNGDAPKLELGIDPSRTAEQGLLEGLLMQNAYLRIQDIFSDPKAMREQMNRSREAINKATDLNLLQKTTLSAMLGAVDQVYDTLPADQAARGGFGGMQVAGIDVVKMARSLSGQPRSAYEITFPSAILWGVLGCAAGFAISLVTERVQGTLLRLRVAPISRTQVLAGKALGCFLACVTSTAGLLLFAAVVFKVRLDVNPLGLFFAIIATAICFVGLMMLMSTLGKTEQAVAGSGWGIIMIMAMIGGGTIPLIAMPPWLQTISVISPVRWGIIALEGAIWRDFTALEMLQTCAVLVTVGVVGFGLGVAMLRRSSG